MKPKIIIGIVAFDSVKPAFMMDILDLCYSGYIKNVIMTCGTLLPINRNKLILNITQMEDQDYTHILMIDGDISDFNLDTLEQLLSANVDIISPLTVDRRPPFRPHLGLLSDKDETDFRKLFTVPQEQRPIWKVAYTATAFMLCKKEVFDRVPFPYFTMDAITRPNFDQEVEDTCDKLMDDPDMDLKGAFYEGVRMGKNHNYGCGPSGEDVNFCRLARKHGLDVHCHTGLYVSHIGETKYNIGDHIELWRNPDLISRLEQTTYVWRPKE